MATSQDGGRNFSKPITISESNGFSIDPSIMILPNSTSDVVTMWTDNRTNNLGIFNIYLKSYLPNYSEGSNANDDDQTKVLLTPGSIMQPQMAAIPSSKANDTLGPENEGNDTLGLIIAGVETSSPDLVITAFFLLELVFNTGRINKVGIIFFNASPVNLSQYFR